MGIVCSIIPIFLVLLFYLLFGNFNQNINGIKMEIIPDLLLVTFAIATNTISVLLDSSDDKFYLIFKGIVSGFSAFIGLVQFCFVFGYITAVNNVMFEIGNIDQASEAEIHEASIKIDKAKDIVLNNVKWKALTLIAVIIIILNIIIGISVIYRNYNPRKHKNDEKTKKRTAGTEKEDANQDEIKKS